MVQISILINLVGIVDIADAANQTEATFETKLPEKPGTLRPQFSHLVIFFFFF